MLQLKNLDKPLVGALHFDYSMHKLNAWKVGGKAECCYFPETLEELSLFLKESCPEGTPITFLGLGSNTLVRDEGVHGAVIILSKNFSKMKRVNTTGVYATAGVPCRKLVRYCTKEKLAGIEFLCGIPGTIGGALAMNAGALGKEIWDFVVAVETINVHGDVQQRDAKLFDVSYRNVHKPEQEWFVGGYFHLYTDDTGEGEDRVRNALLQRNVSQPVEQFNCGCVFKNPENNSAGRLIDQCGLKSCQVGDAHVSQKHANFIVNGGKATALDIETLIAYVQSVVYEKTAVELELEVKIIGGQ